MKFEHDDSIGLLVCSLQFVPESHILSPIQPMTINNGIEYDKLRRLSVNDTLLALYQREIRQGFCLIRTTVSWNNVWRILHRMKGDAMVLNRDNPIVMVIEELRKHDDFPERWNDKLTELERLAFTTV